MNVIIANKYKDMLLGLDIEVIKSLEGVFDVDDIVAQFSNFYFDRMILDVTALRDYNNIETLQKLSINLDMSKVVLLLDDNEESSSNAYLSKLISMGIYNFTRNLEGVRYLLQNPNSYRDVAHIQNLNYVAQEQPVGNGVIPNSGNEANSPLMESRTTRIIGVKDLTEGAGATTLVYMMKKHLEANYSVCAIEVDKRDFLYLGEDADMVSVLSVDLPKEIMKRRELDVILLDLNNYEDSDVCNDIIYLVEPSTIKLNRLIKRDRRAFEKHEKSKIVLNKSNISNNDLNVFEFEAKTKIFYNLPSLDERKDCLKEINGFLSKLGFAKQNVGSDSDSSKGKLLGMFKF